MHFFICSNGYGHIKRVLGIINAILKKNKSVKITIHVNYEHMQIFSSFINEWYPNLDLSQLVFETNSMENSPKYSSIEKYSFNQYNNWLEDIKKLDINKMDLVFSDNLIGLTHCYPHTNLIGSFLWTEIKSLSKIKSYKSIHDFEIKLLLKYKPKIFAINNFLMPGLKNKLKIILFPILCDSRKKRKKDFSFEKRNILISMGNHSKLTKNFTDLVEFLIKSEKFNIYSNNKLYLNFNKRTRIFKYNQDSFDNLDFVIGRPGMGLITDCVKYSLPLIMEYEKSNEEMVHNSKTVANYGFGVKLSKLIDKNNDKLIKFLLSNENYKTLIDSFKKVKKDGNKEIANYILNMY